MDLDNEIDVDIYKITIQKPKTKNLELLIRCNERAFNFSSELLGNQSRGRIQLGMSVFHLDYLRHGGSA
jgi:hypothetical protein